MYKNKQTAFFAMTTNAQLFHKLSHSCMLGHYRVILREHVINKIFKTLELSYFAIKLAEIIMWLQFSWSKFHFIILRFQRL